jgi:hypothetical protein
MVNRPDEKATMIYFPAIDDKAEDDSLSSLRDNVGVEIGD